MAKHDTSKLRILAIERILKVGQFVKCSEIIDALECRYGISADRKTIYDDIAAISRIAPIESLSGKDGGYKLLNVLVEAEQAPFDKDGYICPYNQECRCQIVDCSSCGWNPAVEKRRLNRILSQQGEINYAKRNQKNRI